MTGVPIRSYKDTRDTEGRKPYEGGGRNWDTATRQGTSRNCWQPQEARRKAWNRFSPRDHGKGKSSANTLISDF